MLRLLLSLITVGACLTVQPLHAQAGPGAESKAARPAAVVNLNTASPADLQALPGIGPKVAARIVDYRQKNGPFKKIEEIMNVQGIGEKSFLKIRAQLTVGKSETAGQN